MARDYMDIGSALVWAFLEYAPGAIDTARLHGRDGLGQLLMDECRKSVSHRYPADTPETLPGWAEDYLIPYRYTAPPALPNLYETHKNLSCYQYQSCEHPEWESSFARELITEIRAQVCTALKMTDQQVYDSQEWERAPWGWGEPS